MRTSKTLILSLIILIGIQCNISFSQSGEEANNIILHYGLPVLPGVSGFGQDAVGGRGGEIIVVTNLNREGKGSLAEAIESEGPRIVVFEVAGIIDLGGRSLQIRNPYITIAGQTAPSPGITLIKGGLGIGAHEVIIQHIRIRPGEAGHTKKSGWEVDGISTGGGAYNVIIDHCTTTWATDENLSASGPRFNGANKDEWRKNTSHKVTISNCIIAQGLSTSTHAKGEHSKGTLIHDNATEILVYGNLFADNMDRHPLCKGGSQSAIVNNYVFNPGRAVVHYALNKSEWEGYEWVTGKMTVEGNYIEYGPNTSEKIAAGTFSGPVEVYWKNNMVISKTIIKEFNGNPTFTDNRPVWPDGLVPLPANEVKDMVLTTAGARPWERDEIDVKLIVNVKAGRGKIINSETEAGGYPVITPVYQKFNVAEWDMTALTKRNHSDKVKLLPAKEDSIPPIDMSLFFDGIDHWMMTHQVDYPRYDPREVKGIAENILAFQNADGGWPRNMDLYAKINIDSLLKTLSPNALKSSFDNRNIYPQIEFLSKMYHYTKDERYKISALKGLEYIRQVQNPVSGGWRGVDVDAVTFNDDVMTGIMYLLRDIVEGNEYYSWIAKDKKNEIMVAYQKALDVTLKCQIEVNGKKAAWGQQHDHYTLEPVRARAFELPAICPMESVSILQFLMSLKNPDLRTINAINSAVEWLERVKIEGIRIEQVKIEKGQFDKLLNKEFDRVVVEDPDAPPIWARFYEIETNRPFMCNRDGTKVYSLAEVALERRVGYGWYGGSPRRIIESDYPNWKKLHGIK